MKEITKKFILTGIKTCIKLMLKANIYWSHTEVQALDKVFPYIS